jgi:subtilisin family serine protease
VNKNNARQLGLVGLSLLLLLWLVNWVGQAQSTQANDPDQSQIQVDPRVLAELQENGRATYLIYFTDKADLTPAHEMDWESRGHFVVETLQATAAASQKEVIAYLEYSRINYRHFWVDNVVLVESSTHSTLTNLLTFPEIEAIVAPPQIFLFEPVATAERPANILQAIEPNLVRVKAPDVWQLGITGQGITVASIDSGVRYTHQALVKQYRGHLGDGTFDHNYNWWDPYTLAPAPYDPHDHGSHVTGTMIGDDGDLNQIGMAPGANWMACIGFIPSSTPAALLECAQFLLAPWDLNGENSDPALRPHIINNSWGSCGNPTFYDGWYQGVVDAWVAAGIYPVFANGNLRTPPFGDCPVQLGSVGNPARYGNVTGVGALGRSDGTLASYSLWGPSDVADTINPRGYPFQKPQVSAPGTNRSAGRSSDTHYLDMAGTSMAAPHVSGLVALMWQAAPCLIGAYGLTETIVEETAVPANVGPAYPGYANDGPDGIPNQATGWGEIDALAAVQTAQQSCGPSGTLSGTVIDGSSDLPLAGADVVATLNLTTTRSTLTNNQGQYTIGLAPAGFYTMTAQTFGYVAQTITNVTVLSGMVTVQDFELLPAATYTVRGQVTDATTGWPLYAAIQISNSPYTIWTDPVTGRYTVSLPADIEYQFVVNAWPAGYQPASRAVGPLTEATVADFDLAVDPINCAAPGYGGEACEAQAGGLVVGHVYDDNNGQPLVGALVTGPDGSTTAVATPADDKLDDAFYLLFVPEGSHTLTATMPGGYAPADTAVTIIAGQTIGQNFWLPAGWLTATPQIIEARMKRGDMLTLPLTITNAGAITAEYSLFTALLHEDFEGTFPPENWTVVNNGGDCVWQRNDTWPRPNYAGGAGFSAAADSDECGIEHTMNTELRTPAFDLSAATTARLSFIAAYRHLSASSFRVHVSPNGGLTWHTLLTWTDSVDAEGPGTPVSLDLTPYVGSHNVIVSFHYTAPGWYWWAQVDEVQVLADSGNWLSFAPAAGSLAAGESAVVAIRLNTSALTRAGSYQAALLLEDNTPYSPTILPVLLTVDDLRLYLPVILH